MVSAHPVRAVLTAGAWSTLTAVNTPIILEAHGRTGAVEQVLAWAARQAAFIYCSFDGREFVPWGPSKDALKD